MLKKEKKRAKDSAALLQRLGHNPPGSARGDRTNHNDYDRVMEKVNGHDPSVGSRSSEPSMGSKTSTGSRMNTGSSDDWRRPPTGTGISQEKQKQRIEHDAKVKKKICM